MMNASSRAHIAKRIRVELARRDESRAELCRHIGMKPSTFSGKMRGRFAFTSDELDDISRYLGIKYAEFFSAAVDDEAVLADA